MILLIRYSKYGMMKIKLVMILLQKLLKSLGLLKILIKIKVKLNLYGQKKLYQVLILKNIYLKI